MAGGCGGGSWWWPVRVAGVVVVVVEAGRGCRWGVHAGAGVVVPVAGGRGGDDGGGGGSISSLPCTFFSICACVSSSGALCSTAWPARLGAPGCRAETGDHIRPENAVGGPSSAGGGKGGAAKEGNLNSLCKL